MGDVGRRDAGESGPAESKSNRESVREESKSKENQLPLFLRQFSADKNSNNSAGLFSDAFRVTGGNKEEAEGLAETFHCYICLSNKRVSTGYKLKACGHYFCQSCLADYLESQFQSKQTHPRCFFLTDGKKPCNTEIDVGDLKAVSTPEAWKKYIYFTNKETNENYIDCPKCKLQQIGNSREPWTVCKSETCNHEFCFVHQNQHPKTQTCAEYEAQVRLEEKKNNVWKAVRTKKCPKCGVATEKNHGCNHMTCYVCKTGWCWLCGEVIGNQTIPDHYKDGKCKDKQFTNDTSYMAPWEATCCVLVPFLFLVLFSPIAFVMVLVVCIISPLFFCCLCFADSDSPDDCCNSCVQHLMNILIFGPMFLVTLPFWLPCFIYNHCVIQPRRRRMEMEADNFDAGQLVDAEQGGVV